MPERYRRETNTPDRQRVRVVEPDPLGTLDYSQKTSSVTRRRYPPRTTHPSHPWKGKQPSPYFNNTFTWFSGFLSLSGKPTTQERWLSRFVVSPFTWCSSEASNGPWVIGDTDHNRERNGHTRTKRASKPEGVIPVKFSNKELQLMKEPIKTLDGKRKDWSSS